MMFLKQIIVLCALFPLFSLANNGPDDQNAREEILQKYGSKKQYNNVVQKHNQADLKRKAINFKSRLKEPLISDPVRFNRMNQFDKDDYLKRRRLEREEMSRFVLKHNHLLDNKDKLNLEREQARLKKEKELFGDVDKLVESYYDANTSVKGAELTDTSTEISNENLSGLAKQISKSLGEGGKLNDSFITKFMKGSTKGSALNMIKKNPFSSMSESDIKETILKRTKESSLSEFFLNNPKILGVVTKVLKDQHAVPSMVSIINYPSKMKNYGVICFVVIIIGFFLNVKNNSKGFIKRLIVKVGISLGTVITNFILFYVIFKDQLNPTVNIIKSSF